MKKSLYIASLSLIFVISIFYFNKNENNKETMSIKDGTMNISSDILNDYDDIIIKHGNNEEKLIALTFDDGPDKDFTPQVLDILKKNDIKATFFVVGENVGWNPEILKREYEEGHAIGNHTFTHINVAKRSYGEIAKEISETQEAVKKVIGVEPTLFRPPYRAISKEMCAIARDKNMNIVLWSNLDPRDWSNPGVDYIANTIMSKVENGTIILLHDYNNLRNKKSQTIQAIDIIIPKLKAKGYKFVTVPELMDHMNNKYNLENKKEEASN